MKYHPLVKELIVVFEEYRNDELVVGMKKYMKDRFEYLGIKSPVRADLLKHFLPIYKDMNRVEWMLVVDQLWNLNYREYQYVAIDFCRKKIKEFKVEDLHYLERMITEKSWWDSVDSVASNLIGGYFKMYPKEITPAMNRWTATDNFWLHRTCIIFQLKYGEKTDQKLLFDLCTKYSVETEFFIRKAIGWSLRQYGKFNPDAVKKFISKQKLSPLSIREASKYLD